MKRNLKQHTITARVTDEELDVIKKRATEQNLSMSRYLVEAAVRSDGLLMSRKRSVYRSLEIIKDSARYQKDHNTRIEVIERECDFIWQSL